MAAPSLSRSLKSASSRHMIAYLPSMSAAASHFRAFCSEHRCVWQGVAMDSLKYCQAPPCLTLRCPAGGPLLGVARPRVVLYPFEHPTPHASVRTQWLRQPIHQRRNRSRKLQVSPTIRQTLNG
jgi:hypothetical protein